ncbi:MAG: hypothetical protein AB8I08_03560 [Sandaracinaceae bacterium]
MRWTWGWVILLGVVAALSGCRRRGPVHEMRMVQRYERNLVRLAARDSRCHRQQVQPLRIGESHWVANTCDGPREYFLQCRSRRRWRGCRWRRIATVSQSAAPVLQCPEQMIQQQPTQDANVRVAVGCGRQMTMQLQCHAQGCAWMSGGAYGGVAPTAPAGYGGGASAGASGGGVVYVPAQ